MPQGLKRKVNRGKKERGERRLNESESKKEEEEGKDVIARFEQKKVLKERNKS